MFDDLAAYFVENVLAAYREFGDSLRSEVYGESNDLRLAVNAAVALYHFREHFPSGAQKTRTQLAAICPDYDLLGDIVNAAKHQTLTRGTPRVSAASDIYEEIVLTQYQDQEGAYWDAEKMVMVKLTDGSTQSLRDILTNVLNMWIDELQAIGLLLTLNKVASQPIGIPPRRSKSGTFGMSLAIIPGLRFRYRARLQRHNYSTGKVDYYTGVESATFRVYKPSYVVEVALQLDTGEIIRKDVPLTDEESLEYHRLETDDERSQFLDQLAQKRDLIGEAISVLPEDP